MMEMFTELHAEYGDKFFELIKALVLLLVGVPICIVISAVSRWFLSKLKVDQGLASLIPSEDGSTPIKIEDAIAKAIFLVCFVILGVAVLEALKLEFINLSVSSTLAPVFELIPSIGGAILIMILGFVVAKIARSTVKKTLELTNIDKQLRTSGSDPDSVLSLSRPIAEIAFWIVIVIFMMQALAILGLEDLRRNFESMLSTVFDFLPNLFTAGIILWVGWYIARFIKAIITDSLRSFGLDEFSAKVGVNKALGETTLSRMAGWLVYLVSMIAILVFALETLKFEAVTQPLIGILTRMADFIPFLLGGAVVVSVTWVVARFVGNISQASLKDIGFNTMMDRLGIWKENKNDESQASTIAGKVIFLGILLLGSIGTLSLFKLQGLADLLSIFVQFAGRALLGLLILAAGFYIADWAEKIVLASKAHQKELLGSLAKFAIWVMSGIMALDQMGMANTVVNIAFGILLGGVALAAALAFGLGGTQMAKDLLKKWSDEINSSPTRPKKKS